MISHISIKDFAIIESAEIDFHHGLNIVTGETGAGKSIVIEAVSLALGSRADTAFVRSGKEKAVVQLVAELSDEDIILTREVSASGKNLCRINGEIVTLSQLSAVCKKIADVHGQYDHQSLLNPENHIHFVDLYNSSAILPAKEKVAVSYHLYRDTKTRLSSILSNYEENLRKRDFMAFELSEITNAKLIPGEDETLTQEILLMQNSEKIYQNLSGAYAVTYEDSPSALEGLKRALNLLQDISEYMPEVTNTALQFSESYYLLEDLAKDIRRIRDRVTFSQEALDSALERLDLIDGLKRKYGGSIERILEYGKALEEQLSYIENIDEVKAKLTAELAKYEQELKSASNKLTSLRKESAKELEKKIQSELAELCFSNSALSISFAEENTYTETGLDKVEFLISTNKGEPQKPLSKIASGGEMSRIMLAFKKIIADYDDIQTMIFDEIDSGISGIAASIVGKKLCQIAEKHQIICITHLPQIAAFGAHNYKINKQSDDNMTYTTVLSLSEQEKVQEIARLLGGINITEKTLDSAKELIALSK